MKTGDKVICIKSHSQRVVVKGDEYYVCGILRCPYCNMLWISVGIKSPRPFIECGECSNISSSGCDWMFSSLLFRKIEPHKFKNSVTKKLANKPLVKETIEEEKILIS